VDSVLFAVQDLALPQEIGNQLIYAKKLCMYCLQPRIWRFHSTLMATGSLLGMLSYVARIRGYGYRYAIRGYSDTPFFQKQGYGDTPIYIKNKNK